jgi:hypothetical protein
MPLAAPGKYFPIPSNGKLPSYQRRIGEGSQKTKHELGWRCMPQKGYTKGESRQNTKKIKKHRAQQGTIFSQGPTETKREELDVTKKGSFHTRELDHEEGIMMKKEGTARPLLGFQRHCGSP